MNTIKDFADTVASAIRGSKTAPAPDEWNPGEHRVYRLAGDNKFGYRECPFCGKPGTTIADGHSTKDVFLFKDTLSAREYQISGLCQSCQDSAFGSDDGC